MLRQVQVNATDARKKLFELIDLAVKEDLEVLISKKGLGEVVVLKKVNGNKTVGRKTIKDEVALAKSLYGSIKTSGYKKNEMELARKAFVRDYKKKHNL